MLHIRSIQMIYILILSIILYIIYQYATYKKPLENEVKVNTIGSKFRIFLFIGILSTCFIIYFNIGLDQIQIDGESKSYNLLNFEKAMIHKINEEVDVGIVPF